MNKRNSVRLILAMLATLLVSATAWAKVLPPPVNQLIGIPDSTFNNLAEADCRLCHNQNPPAGIPVEPTYLPSRHHGLVPAVGATPTADQIITDPTAAPNGIIGQAYACTSCHTFIWNPMTGVYDLDPNFRDCTLCHMQVGGVTVHHATTLAQTGDCEACHNLVENPTDTFTTMAADPANAGDAHYVPNYRPSMVTPWPSAKPNGDTTNINAPAVYNGATLIYGGKEAGNCNFCHDANLETGTLENGVLVFTNAQTHHSTGLFVPTDIGDPNGKCTWCHNTQDPAPPAMGGTQFANTPMYRIRACERCHSVATLHNIQVNSMATGMVPRNIYSGPGVIGTEMVDNATVIVPGLEDAGYGHIGAQWDCWGCHGSDGVEQAAPAGGPAIPFISGVDKSRLPAGTATQITLRGSAFTNLVEDPMFGGFRGYECQVLLTDAAGAETLLTPDSIANDSLTVTIPAKAAGNYTLVAKKFLMLSNPINLAITPVVSISDAACVGGTTTITGGGFTAYDGFGAVTKVSSLVTTTTTTREIVGYNKKGRPIYEDVTKTVTDTVAGDVSSWTDSEIVAEFPACGTKVEVAAVFGSASANVSGGTTVPPVDPPAPVPTDEICNDRIDNDLDGRTDCDDRDCRKSRYCR
ncbi:hypothetical protein [Trichloromonas sp.]|uniref:hypothetical protein n=1 Tax=Trichloromonas sp. TaxID=3069249 RepID=UPI003D819EC4